MKYVLDNIFIYLIVFTVTNMEMTPGLVGFGKKFRKSREVQSVRNS